MTNGNNVIIAVYDPSHDIPKEGELTTDIERIDSKFQSRERTSIMKNQTPQGL